MPQRRTGFTTVVDLNEFNQMTWTFLTNITQTWQYDGIAYQFRKAGIPLYGIDRGTMKMNHPIACMAVPQHKDKNYGVDIYVPVEDKKRASKLVADADHVRKCAELEACEGPAAREQFERQATALRESNAEAFRARRREKRASIMSILMPHFAAKNS